jgi:hypothetical protein
MPKRTQYECLWAVYERFGNELKKCGETGALALAQAWDNGKSQHRKWLDDPASKISRSSLAAGMKQGLRELPRLLESISPEARKHLRKILRQILCEEMPGLISKEVLELERILKRGKIVSENEYYLVRHQLDEVEGREAHRQEAVILMALLDRFDASGRVRH